MSILWAVLTVLGVALGGLLLVAVVDFIVVAAVVWLVMTGRAQRLYQRSPRMQRVAQQAMQRAMVIQMESWKKGHGR